MAERQNRPGGAGLSDPRNPCSKTTAGVWVPGPQKPQASPSKRPRSSSPDHTANSPHAFSAFRSVPPAFTNCTPGVVPPFGDISSNSQHQTGPKPPAKKAKWSPPSLPPVPRRTNFLRENDPNRDKIFGSTAFGVPSPPKGPSPLSLTTVDSLLNHVEGSTAVVTQAEAGNAIPVQTSSFCSALSTSKASLPQTPPGIDLTDGSRFQIMFDTGHDSDLTINAGGTSFRMHKVVVQPLSPWIAKSWPTGQGQKVVTMPEAADVVDSMLRYMYGLKVPMFAATWNPDAGSPTHILHNIERLRAAAVKYEVARLAVDATEQLSLALKHFSNEPDPVVSVATSLYSNTQPTNIQERAIAAGATFSVLEGIMAEEKCQKQMMDCKDLCRDVLTLAATKLGQNRQAGHWWRAEDAIADKSDDQTAKQIEAPKSRT